MSRLAAVKEFAFMKVLGEKGVRVPEAVGQNRHTVVMGLVEGVPLRQVRGVGDPGGLYAEVMEVLVRLRGLGVVHGDFNEFNIMIEEEGGRDEEEEGEKENGKEDGISDGIDRAGNDDDRPTKLTPVIIDFPQMLSISHANATFYFDRDVACIRDFFQRKFGFVSDVPGPFLTEEHQNAISEDRIDVQVEASGFSRKMEKELQNYMKEVGADGHKDRNGEENEGEDSEESGGGDEDDGRHEDEEHPEHNAVSIDITAAPEAKEQT